MNATQCAEELRKMSSGEVPLDHDMAQQHIERLLELSDEELAGVQEYYDATQARLEQQGGRAEREDGDEGRQGPEAGGRHSLEQGREVEQEEVTHAKQNELRVKAARARAQAYREARTRPIIEEHVEESAALKNERRLAERALVETILDDEGTDRLERLKMARMEMDRMIRHERAERRKQPIVVNIQMPEIKLPEIKMPAFPEFPEIKIPPMPPVVIPKQEPTVVTVNVPKQAAPVVNYSPPAAKDFTLKAVRDEAGNVLSYRKVSG